MRSYIALSAMFIVDAIYKTSGQSPSQITIIGLVSFFLGAVFLDVLDRSREKKI